MKRIVYRVAYHGNQYQFYLQAYQNMCPCRQKGENITSLVLRLVWKVCDTKRAGNIDHSSLDTVKE